MLCSWTRHFTLTVPLSAQEYKWVPGDKMLGDNLRWTSIPSSGSSNTPSRLHATETGTEAPAGVGQFGPSAALALPRTYARSEDRECMTNILAQNVIRKNLIYIYFQYITLTNLHTQEKIFSLDIPYFKIH